MIPSYRELSEAGWVGGLSDGTPCGRGSMIANTREVRDLLPVLADDYGVRTVSDAGAGDLHWIRHVHWDVEYQGYDLVPRHPDVRELDITKDLLPISDLILCRFVLGHLPPVFALAAVNLFRKSASTYLLASNPESVDYSKDLYGTFNKWDIRKEPFSLGDPLETFPDTGEHNLCLWKL